MAEYEDTRYIATSRCSDAFVIANREGGVKFFKNSRLVELPERRFDLGGKRMAISSQGDWLVVASYKSKVVVCYSLDDCKRLWERPGFKMCNEVKFVEQFDETIFVNTYPNKSYLLSVKDGRVQSKLDCISCWNYPRDPNRILFERKDDLALLDRQVIQRTSVVKTTFAVLDGCFVNPDVFLVAYSGGPLELVDLNSQKKKWELRIEGHFIKVGYAEHLDKVFAIAWNYKLGGATFLFHVDISTGAVMAKFDLGRIVDVAFRKNYSELITTTGAVYSTERGDLIHQLNFDI
ncbi:MAG: hypothetical protein ACK5DD_14075 [Cyclobacteriaceae bacterium]|jgi:hypothetical protein